MATVATLTTDPQLEYLRAERVEGGKNPPGAPYEAYEGYQWVRAEVTVSLYRIMEGLQSFTTLVNMLRAYSNVKWFGGAAELVAAESSGNWRTHDHTLTEEHPGADMWRETIVYKWVGAWTEEAASASDFENVDFA